MTVLFLLTFGSFLIIGGVISIIRNRMNYYPIAVKKAVIQKWERQKGESGLFQYHPTIEFNDKNDELTIKTLVAGSGLFFNPMWFYNNKQTTIWITINKNNEISTVLNTLFNLFMSLSVIGFGLIIIIELQVL